MSDLTVKSPGFYARELEIFPTAVIPNGLGAGAVGTAELGPAFVPVTVGSQGGLSQIFGNFGSHQGLIAGSEYLRQGGSTFTYMRVLGAGTGPRTVFNSPNEYLSYTPNAGFVVGFDNHISSTLDDEWLEDNIVQMSATLPTQKLFSAANENANIYFIGGFFTDSDLANSLSGSSVSIPQINNLSPLLESAGYPAQYSPNFSGSLVTAGSVSLTSVTGTTVTYSSPIESPHVIAASLTDGRPVVVSNVVSGTSSVSFGVGFSDGASSTTDVVYSLFDLSGTIPQITGSNLVRGVIFAKDGYRPVVSSSLGYSSFGEIYDVDGGALNTSAAVSANYDNSKFKFAVLSASNRGLDGFYRPSSDQIVFGPVDVSFNPNESNYFSNVLNADPNEFTSKGHILYARNDVLDSQISLTGTIPGTLDIASNVSGTSGYTFTTLSGSVQSTATGSLTSKFPRYTPVFCTPPTSNNNVKWHNYIDRFKTPAAPMIISQPIGGYEYDLFRVHSRHDGVNGNTLFKVTISNIRYPNAENPNLYPTFSVIVRSFYDTDRRPIVLETFNDLNLDPRSDKYVVRAIGSMRTYLDLDWSEEEDRKITQTGDYENNSSFIYVEPTEELDSGALPQDCVPFGFAGIETLNLSTGFDLETSAMNTFVTSSRNSTGLNVSGTNVFLSTYQSGLTFSGTVAGAYRGYFVANGGDNTATVGSNTKTWMPVSESTIFNVSSSFTASQPFQIFGNFSGTVSAPNNDYFSITRQADISTVMSATVPPVPYRLSLTRGPINSIVGVSRDLSLCWGLQTEETDLSSPRSLQDPNASQITNFGIPSYLLFFGVPETGNMTSGTFSDTYMNNKFSLAKVELGADRTTSLSSLQTLTIADSVKFRYKRDGVSSGTGSMGDITSLDKKNRSVIWNRINAAAKFTFPVRGGFDGTNLQNRNMNRLNNSSVKSGALTGSSSDSQEVFVYNEAARLMLDKTNTDIEVFAIPGITEPLVTNETVNRVESYFDAIYIMDQDQSSANSVSDFLSTFEARSLDTNFAATYFPNVRVQDSSGKSIEISPSPVVVGAIALNDRLGQPWFAPAGLSRGALSSVKSVTYKLNQGDRDNLYEAGVNPIIALPGQGYVLFGQKTLDQSESALNRINIRRLMIRIRRTVRDLSNEILFEQYTQQTVDRFRMLVDSAMKSVQALSGINSYRIDLFPDFTNSTLNGTIRVSPIKSIEFVKIDFIIDKSGVTFA